MEYIYGSLLLHRGGKKVDEAGLKSVLSAAGITPDDARIKSVVAALEGVNIDEAVASASIPAAAAPAAAVEKSPAQKKEEKKDEGKSETESAAGLAGLFG